MMKSVSANPSRTQHEDLAPPARQQLLEHRDAALAVRAARGHLPVDGQRHAAASPRPGSAWRSARARPRPGRRCPAGSPASRSSRRRSGTSPATRNVDGGPPRPARRGGPRGTTRRGGGEAGGAAGPLPSLCRRVRRATRPAWFDRLQPQGAFRVSDPPTGIKDPDPLAGRSLRNLDTGVRRPDANLTPGVLRSGHGTAGMGPYEPDRGRAVGPPGRRRLPGHLRGATAALGWWASRLSRDRDRRRLDELAAAPPAAGVH